MARLSLGHDSDTMLDERDSSGWYDIVHFEHKALTTLLWPFSKDLVPIEIVFLDYKPMMIPLK